MCVEMIGKFVKTSSTYSYAIELSLVYQNMDFLSSTYVFSLYIITNKICPYLRVYMKNK